MYMSSTLFEKITATVDLFFLKGAEATKQIGALFEGIPHMRTAI